MWGLKIDQVDQDNIHRWNQNFKALKKYLAQHKTYPSSHSGSLGRWVSLQRRFHKEKRVSLSRVRQLESLPNWSWNPLGEKWNQNFDLLKKYVTQHKIYPSQSPTLSLTPQSKSLAGWISERRKEYKDKTLSRDRIQKLESLPGWSWGRKKKN